MTRTEHPETGSCRIALTSPVAAFIERHCGVAAYLEHLLAGRLDVAGRTHKFNSDPGDRHWNDRDITLPERFPALKGDVTWRRRDGRWQLDVTEALLVDGVTWQEQIAQSVCDGALLIPGTIPEALRISGKGEKVSRIVGSDLFDDRCIIHQIIDWPGSPPSQFGKGRADMTKIYIHCERTEYYA